MAIFATNTEVQNKAGANVNAISLSGGIIDDFMTQAESLINVATRKNWSDVYTTLNEDVKGILKKASSAHAAMMIIQYDMSGIGQREAETRLDVLNNEFTTSIKELVDQSKKGFIENA